METEVAQAVATGPAMVATLADYGALGVMVIFLAWQHWQLSKRQREDQAASQERADKLMDRFEAQLNELQTKYEAREDDLRARYDAVVSDLNLNRDTLKNEIYTSLEAAQSKLDTALGKLDEGLNEIRSMQQEAAVIRRLRESGTTQQ